MAKAQQPGGLYLAPDGKTMHDAWNRPVEQGVTTFNPPAEVKEAPREAGSQPVGGQIDTPAPGSDMYREYEARMREIAELARKEAERFAAEQEKLRKATPTVVIDAAALAQLQALASQVRVAEPNVGPTREEHKAAGEAWEKKEQERLDKLAETSLAVDTNRSDPKKLEKGGQTEGESEMGGSKKGSHKAKE